MGGVLVSIIIPIYNVAHYIEDCLRSVMRQSYTGSVECIIVDDCGKDSSIPIVERMIASYDGPIRFEVLHHDHNRGLSAARNSGLHKANGDYVFFLDGDDMITEDCLNKMMSLVAAYPELELVQGCFICHREGHNTTGPKTIRIEHACTSDEVRDCFYRYGQVSFSAWNKLMKRSLIEEYHLSFIEGLLWEDVPWLFYWLKYVKNAYFLPDVTYHYQIRAYSIVTETSSVERDLNQLRGRKIIVTNITPGHEKEELAFFVKGFARIYAIEVRHLSECKEVFQLFWNNVRRYKCYSAYLYLIVGYVLGQLNWGSRLVPGLIRIMHSKPFRGVRKRTR